MPPIAPGQTALDFNQIIIQLQELDLTEAQIAKLNEVLNQPEPDEIATKLAAPTTGLCPVCGKLAKKNGTVRGKARYKCLNTECGKSFGDTTNAITASSRLNAAQWAAYLPLFLRQQSIPKIVKELGIDTKTAYRCRIKILRKLQAAQAEYKFSGVVEVDETYLAQSYKGDPYGVEFVRNSHKRGKEVDQRGISKQQVSIVALTDRRGNMFMFQAGNGYLKPEMIKPVLDKMLNKEITLVSDRHKTYEKYAASAGIEVKQSKGKASRSGVYNVQTVNALHSQFKRWLKAFNGISTKQLDLYLAWFMWDQQRKGLTESAKLNALVETLTQQQKENQI